MGGKRNGYLVAICSQNSLSHWERAGVRVNPPSMKPAHSVLFRGERVLKLMLVNKNHHYTEVRLVNPIRRAAGSNQQKNPEAGGPQGLIFSSTCVRAKP
jgi:hypothetical protein